MTDQTIRSWSLIKGHTSVCNCNHYKSTAIYEYRLVGCKKARNVNWTFESISTRLIMSLSISYVYIESIVF